MTGQTSTPGIVPREVCRRVHNNLTSADDPEPGAETVHVRARTQFGDVLVARPSVPVGKGVTR
jgi:hypothetical protein